MKNNKSFMEQMKDYKFKEIRIPYTVSYSLLLVLLFVFGLSLEISLFSKFEIRWVNLIVGVSFLLLIVDFIYYIINMFKRNSILFREGDVSKGIINFAVIVVATYLLLFILLFSINYDDIRELILNFLSSLTTVFAAILALIGVHYSLINKKNEKRYDNSLIFMISKKFDREIKISDDIGFGKNLILENLTDNFCFLTGIYKVCGNDIYSLCENFKYNPIKPKETIKLSNIQLDKSDEEMILIYKDILENCYCMNLSVIKDEFIINSISKLDENFIRERIEESNKALSNTFIETKIDVDEFEDKIVARKEETKPKYIKEYCGYEVIVDENGNQITDFNLLKKLERERKIIAKEKQVRAYMVFNNQQLVSIATYKPKTKFEFISIYGLGERKYEMYGERFINIYKN